MPFSSGESPKSLHQVNKFCIFQSYKSLEKDLRMRQANFASTAKDSPPEIKQSIFVAWEQVLNASAKANIQHAATKVTNMDYFIP